MLLHDVSGRVHEEVRRERELQRENYLARYTAMGDMAMAIAHELGQPLAAAGNFLGGATRHAEALTAAGELSPAAAEPLVFGIGSAVRQIDRASTIVSAVRAFVGHLEHVRQVADLGEILAECLYFVRLRADAAGVEIVVREHAGARAGAVRARAHRAGAAEPLLQRDRRAGRVPAGGPRGWC